jgi:hypothetical protein
VADNYRDQQAEGLITIEGLREKLDGIAGERDALEARLAMLASAEERLRELDSLPALVDAYLRDLPELVGRERIVREYETVPEKHTESNPLGVHALPGEHPASARRGASPEAPRRRGRPLREVSGDLRYDRSAGSGAPERRSGHQSGRAILGIREKGVMPWDESG